MALARYIVEWYPADEVEAYLVKHPEDRDGNEVAVASDIVGSTIEYCDTVEQARKVAAEKAPLDFFGCAHITREHRVPVSVYDGRGWIWERDESFELEEV